MAFNISVEKFSIKVTGEVTGEEFAGDFECLPALPFALQMEEDRIRRELLGNLPENASPRARNAADIFSFLAVHITKAPLFWTQYNNGQTLFDDNVVGAVYSSVTKIVNDFAAARRAKVEAAKKDLNKITNQD